LQLWFPKTFCVRLPVVNDRRIVFFGFVPNGGHHRGGAEFAEREFFSPGIAKEIFLWLLAP
jgi:hypothetical protein